jgi:hypothetical protein
VAFVLLGCSVVQLAWTAASVCLMVARQLARSAGRRVVGWPVAAAIHRELRPFYLPAALWPEVWGAWTNPHQVSLFWRLAYVVIIVINWFVYKDIGDDDDCWKRRRRKVVGKIRELASGRLTVEPAGAW